MGDIVKCNVCDKVMIIEEANSHICNPRLRSFKTIEIAWYSVGKDEYGRECIYAKGTNGIVYNLIVKEQKLIPLSHENLIASEKILNNSRIAPAKEDQNSKNENPDNAPESKKDFFIVLQLLSLS